MLDHVPERYDVECLLPFIPIFVLDGTLHDFDTVPGRCIMCPLIRKLDAHDLAALLPYLREEQTAAATDVEDPLSLDRDVALHGRDLVAETKLVRLGSCLSM